MLYKYTLLVFQAFHTCLSPATFRHFHSRGAHVYWRTEWQQGGPDIYGDGGLTHGLLQNYNLLLTWERLRICMGRPRRRITTRFSSGGKKRTKTGCTIPLKSPRPLGEAPVTWSTAPLSNIRCYHQAASEADKQSDSDDLSEAHIVCDAPKPCRETCLHEVNIGCRLHGLGTIRPYNKGTTMKPIQKDSI